MQHPIVEPGTVRVDARGTFIEALNGGRWESLICGSMKAEAVMGDHFHRQTVVFFFLTAGAAQIDTVDVTSGERDRVRLDANQGLLLRTGESHAIRFLQDSQFVMLKSRRYDAADPDTFAFPVTT